MAGCKKVNVERCCGFPTVSLWLIESNWPRVFFALSSKTDHFVWLETSWHTLSIRFWGNSPSPYVFCGPSPSLYVSLLHFICLSVTDRPALSLSLSLSNQQTKITNKIGDEEEEKVEKKMEGRNKGWKNPASWSMIQCQGAGERPML